MKNEFEKRERGFSKKYICVAKLSIFAHLRQYGLCVFCDPAQNSTKFTIGIPWTLQKCPINFVIILRSSMVLPKRGQSLGKNIASQSQQARKSK